MPSSQGREKTLPQVHSEIISSLWVKNSVGNHIQGVTSVYEDDGEEERKDNERRVRQKMRWR